MPSECVIRRMVEGDIDAVAAVEAATFPTPWSRDAFASEMRTVAARYLVAEADGQVIGFAGAWVILDEAHVTNIAVLQAFRGRGIGRMLTAALMQYLANLGAAYVTLEVRRSNAVAQGLYESLGFQRLGVRKRYYEDNGEDALIMVCDRMPEAQEGFEEPETLRE